MSKLKQGLVALIVVCLLVTVLPAWAATTDIDSGIATASNTSTDVTLVDSNTVWNYLDDGTDPTGDSSSADYNRIAWTLESFDDSAWKSAAGTFGSKSGKLTDLGSSGKYIPTVLLNHYINGSSNPTVPTYFFRTTVTLDRAYTGVVSGTVLYDDSATIYINGMRVAGFYDSELTGNLSYGGSNGGEPLTGSFSVDASCLKHGENIIAVEVHNSRNSSSDEWFSMPEMIVDESVEAPKEKSICISVGEDETQRNITWYSPYADTTASVQYAAKNGNDFPSSYSEATATVKSSTDGDYYYCQAVMTDLVADTEYIYRFKNGNIISQSYTFSVGADGSFSFIFVGDPQIGASGNAETDGANWAATLNTALNHFPETSFLVSAGDQVNSAGSESEYAQYLSPEAMTSLTTATVIGNHDTASAAHSQHFMTRTPPLQTVRFTVQQLQEVIIGTFIMMFYLSILIQII